VAEYTNPLYDSSNRGASVPLTTADATYARVEDNPAALFNPTYMPASAPTLAVASGYAVPDTHMEPDYQLLTDTTA
jgi:hypothetical protein